MKMIKFASLISPENLAGLQVLKQRDQRSIVFLLNQAVRNFLILKKVAGYGKNKI